MAQGVPISLDRTRVSELGRSRSVKGYSGSKCRKLGGGGGEGVLYPQKSDYVTSPFSSFFF